MDTCTDLIILGLAWKTTEEELRGYFTAFGNVARAQVGALNNSNFATFNYLFEYTYIFMFDHLPI